MRKPQAKTNLSSWVLMPAVCPEMVCRSRFLPGSNGMTLAKAHVAAATSTQGTLTTGLCTQNSSQLKAASSPSSSTFKPPVWVQAESVGTGRKTAWGRSVGWSEKSSLEGQAMHGSFCLPGWSRAPQNPASLPCGFPCWFQPCPLKPSRRHQAIYWSGK